MHNITKEIYPRSNKDITRWRRERRTRRRVFPQKFIYNVPLAKEKEMFLLLEPMPPA
jgi:hypothetical protein